jgi:hypothetical protein
VIGDAIASEFAMVDLAVDSTMALSSSSVIFSFSNDDGGELAGDHAGHGLSNQPTVPIATNAWTHFGLMEAV